MSLIHLAPAAVMGPTLAIPVKALPPDWQSSQWYEDLSVTPITSSVSNTTPPPVNPAFIRNEWLHLPRFKGLELVGGRAPQDRRTTGVAMTEEVVFSGELRESPPQVQATSQVMDSLHTTGGAMLVLPCGFGKTVCSIWILTQLRRRALVLVHTGALADQWVERVKSFLPHARVGRIQQNTVDVDGCDIVVGMIQSLVRREYDRSMLASFGTVVVDEAHHIAAPWFSGALRKLPARYVLGLSATPDRKDGLGKILPWLLGDIAFRATRDAETVGVNLITYNDPDNQRELRDRRGKPRYSEMLSNLGDNPERNARIVSMIVEQVASGRTLIVLSERRNQLLELERRLLEHPGAECITLARPRKKRRKDPTPELAPPSDQATLVVARVMGGTPPDIRDHGFRHANVLLSTYPYAAEGIDIPRLDTLVMASPGINTEQTVGRILRRHPGKKVPLVVDIKDPFSLFDGMGWKRIGYYNSQKYSITHTAWDPSE